MQNLLNGLTLKKWMKTIEMDIEEVLENLESKFTSLNDIAVERVSLTRKEYDVLLKHLNDIERDQAALWGNFTAYEQ